MMKVILPVVIIILVGFLFWDKVFLPSKTAKISEITQTVQAEKQTIKESSASGKYVIDIEYPKFSNSADLEIKKLIDKNKTDFLTEVKTNKPIPELKNISSTFTVRYEIFRSDERFVSISFDVTDYQPGMAHPNNFVQVFNFDLNQNKVLQLSDIFTKDADYLSLLSKLSFDDLNKQFKSDPNAKDFIKSGTSAKQENFQNFAMTKDALIILFNPAQVAPAVDGMEKVSIPWKDLGNTLSQKF